MHARVRRLQLLAIAQRAQHHQHHGTERGEGGLVPDAGERDRAYQRQVGQPGVDRGHEATDDAKAARRARPFIQKARHPGLDRVANVEHVHFHAEPGDLARRDGERHAIVRRPSRMELNTSSQRAQREPEQHQRGDRDERPHRIDPGGERQQRGEGEERHDPGAEAGQQRRPGIAVGRDELLQATGLRPLLRGPRRAQKRSRESLAELAGDVGVEASGVPVRRC